MFKLSLLKLLSQLKPLQGPVKAMDSMIAVPVKKWQENYRITATQFCNQRVKEPTSAVYGYKFHTFRYNGNYYFIRLK